MIQYFYRTLLLFLLGFLSSWAGAVEIQAGQIYSAGTKVEASELGLALTIPAGWRGGLPQGGAYFTLVSDDNSAEIYVSSEQATEAELKQFLSQPLQLGNGVSLRPMAALAENNGVWGGDYELSPPRQGIQAHIQATIVRGNLGVAFVGLANGPARATMQSTVLKLARSLQVSEPKPDSSQGSWLAYLRGRYIVRYYTTTGYTEEQHIWLCSDGSFFRSTSGGGFGGGASGAFQGRGDGRWTAKGRTDGQGSLILQYGQGAVSRGSTPGQDWEEYSAGGDRLVYSLSFDAKNKLYLDGKQWLRDGNQRCQ